MAWRSAQQYPPAAWASQSLTQLQTDVYNYTYDVCTALKSQGTTPDSVQVGNEINVGMLWPRGQVVSSNFAPLASLLCLLVSFAFWFDQRPPALAWLEPHVPETIASSLDSSKRSHKVVAWVMLLAVTSWLLMQLWFELNS